MKRRSILLIALAVSLLNVPSGASSQVMDTYTTGYSMHRYLVWLTAGAMVTFETDSPLPGPPGVTSGDTVMSLLNYSNQSVAGADGCAGVWGPSCFSYVPTYTGLHWLIVRSWREYTPAVTRVYGYGTGTPNGPMTTGSGEPEEIIAGGGRVTGALLASGWQHLTTAFMPGNAASHTMLFYDTSNEWGAYEQFAGNTGAVGGLAAFEASSLGSIPANAGVAYGGLNASNQGPLRILRNNYQTADYDNDGLSYDLEVDLGTCDHPWQSSACGAKQFCSSPFSTEICRAQLRDTDGDGLRDDVEVIGYDHSLAQMPRYGADPLHTDVFVELHTNDRVPEDGQGGGLPGCQSFALDGTVARDPRWFGGETAGDNTHERIAQIYGQAPAHLNPDGTPGFRIHFDVGVPNPDPTATDWNDWGGGGTCYGDTDYTKHCFADRTPERAWLFRWGYDHNVGGGRGGPECYVAGSTVAHVHELGHVLGLGHGGPYGASGNVLGGNQRPLYPSRMNYRYDAIGGSSNPTFWDQVTFSSLGNEDSTSSRGTAEVSPVGSTRDFNPLNLGEPQAPVWVSDSSSFDWNDDGVLGGTTVWEGYRLSEVGSYARSYLLGNTPDMFRASRFGNHLDAAISRAEGVLTFALVDRGWTGTLGNVIFAADSDGDCLTVPASDGAGRASYGDCVAVGKPINTFIAADAVSIASSLLPVPGKSPVEGLIMVTRRNTKLYWYEVDVLANTHATEAGYTVTGGGLIPGWSVNRDPNSVLDFDPSEDDTHEATLVEVPASSADPHGGVLLIGENSSNQLTRAWLPPAGSAWSGPLPVTDSTGALIGDVKGDVGAVVFEGDLYFAARKVGDDFVTIWSVPPGSNHLTPWTEVAQFPGGLDAIDVELSWTPAPPGKSLPEFLVFFRTETDEIRESYTSDFLTWSQTADLHSNGLAFSVGAAVYDDRPVVGTSTGIRYLRARHMPCSGTADFDTGRDGDCIQYPVGTGDVNDFDCETGGSQLYCRSSAMNGHRPVVLWYMPFAEGHNPTQYCGYDDWPAMAWHQCEFRGAPLPSGPGVYGSEPYDTAVRCANRPVFREPTTLGTCEPVSVDPGMSGPEDINDRTDNPGAYYQQ